MKKISTSFAIIVILLVGGFLAFVFIQGANFSFENNQIQDYYDGLRNKCASDSCCLSSVDSMKASNAKLAENGECEAPFVKDMLKCEGTYVWCDPSDVSAAKSPELIGGQKDEHGCLIPAGYSWCEEKQKCLRVWEEKCDETSNWKDYKNEEFGYELKIPNDFYDPISFANSGNPIDSSKCFEKEKDKCGFQVHFGVQDMENFDIASENDDLDYVYSLHIGNESTYSEKNKENYAFNEFPALQYNNTKKDSRYERGIIVKKGSKYFVINMYIHGDGSFDKGIVDDLFPKILSTFKFTK